MSTIPGQIIHGALWLFLVFCWVRFAFDWVQVFARRWRPTGLVVALLEMTYTVTDPPIRAVRRVIPPLRFGGISIDLAFLVVLLVAYILMRLTAHYLL